MRMKKGDLEKLVKEAVDLLKQDDSLQASEKLYKVAEECIKILAIKKTWQQQTKGNGIPKS